MIPFFTKQTAIWMSINVAQFAKWQDKILKLNSGGCVKIRFDLSISSPKIYPPISTGVKSKKSAVKIPRK